jgi:hypothetical protein
MCAVRVIHDGLVPGRAQPPAAAVIGFVVAVLTTAPASTVFAYRTLATEAELDLPMRRESTRVQVTLHAPAGDAGAPSVAEVEEALLPAASAWVLPCLDFEAVVAGPSGHVPDPNDGITTVSIVRSGWLARGYAAEQAANTEVTYEERPDSVLILDADIYVNADTIDWNTEDLDLRAILHHELGHALYGATHPCGSVLPPPCTEEIAAESVMHPLYQPGAWQPRTDDVAMACALTFARPCEGLVCAADEYCDGQACVHAPSCADGERCEGVCGLGGPTRDMCIDPGSQGAPCVSGNDCTGRLCLTARAISYCTRSCTAADECTADQVCRPVEGVLVCAPPSQSGCSVVATRPTTGWWRVLLPLALLTLAIRTRSGQR